MPCIGQSLNFDFFHADLVWSNLGGFGPDSTAPQEIRYTNVASITTADGTVTYLDLAVVVNGQYTPFTVGNNGLNGKFARINFAAGTCADLRVYVRPSCASASPCSLCDDPIINPSSELREQCYSRGCACFGQTITDPNKKKVLWSAQGGVSESVWLRAKDGPADVVRRWQSDLVLDL